MPSRECSGVVRLACLTLAAIIDSAAHACFLWGQGWLAILKFQPTRLRVPKARCRTFAAQLWRALPCLHAAPVNSRPTALRQAEVSREIVATQIADQVAQSRAEHGTSNQAFVARDAKGNRAGFVWVDQVRSGFTGKTQGYLLDIVVVEARRGRGLGQLLMAEAEGWARQRGFDSLTLSSAAASNRQFIAELARLKVSLPQDLQDTLERYEAVGDYHNPQYESAVGAFLGPLFCRLDPWPELLTRTMEIFRSNRVAYETIWGPNDLNITGNLQGWESQRPAGRDRRAHADHVRMP